MKIGNWLATVVACVFVVTTVQASYDPNSYQSDLIRAREAHGCLFSWDGKPLGNRHPWLVGTGKHSENATLDGISEAKVREIWSMHIANWQAIYKATCGRELFQDVAIYGYGYNSDRDLTETSRDMGLLIEANQDLTYRDGRINACVHSLLGDILFVYWANGGKKINRKVTLGTPHLGGELAPKEVAANAVRKVYGRFAPVVLAVISKRKVVYDSPGHLWLTPGYEPMMRLRRDHPLDDGWYLYAGKIKPLPNKLAAKAANAAMIADAVLLAGGFGQEPHAYKLSALLIQESGETGGSDGMVSVRSAHAVGYAGNAHTRMMEGHHHSDMLQGWGGSLKLHAQTLADMVDFDVPGGPSANNFDLWLPSVPSTELWRGEDKVDWAKVRCAGWTERGELVVAEAHWDNPKTLRLSEGRCAGASWYGEGLLVTIQTSDRLNVHEVNDQGVWRRLTNDGISRSAGGSAKGDLVAYVGGHALLLRNTNGVVSRLVKSGVTTDLPVFIRDKAVWWYQGSRIDGYTLCSISIQEIDAEMGRVTHHGESFKGSPFSFAGAPMYVDFGFETDFGDDANRLRTVPTGEWRWGRLRLNPALLVLGRLREIGPVGGNSTIDQLAVDSQTGDIYLLVDGMARWVDVKALIPESGSWQEWARHRARLKLGLDQETEADRTGTGEYEIRTPFVDWAKGGSLVEGMTVR